ncbi:MAG TPA: outer membrane protein assembly factor BamA [Verrucomicrobiae bacterium]|jgi:outer membrane protein insertion porin family|nr:outer membrane protein assembly factor BamA [Verrucomicrobiae bacterium]
MKFLFRLCGLLLVLACLPASAQISSLKVSKIVIKHIGPQSVSDDLIRANIRVKPGDPYLRAAIDEDVRTLYATGQFYDIRVTDDNTPSGVTLTYVVQGNPRVVAIKFAGNKKYKDSKLLKKMTLKVGEPLNERKLFTDGQEMEKMYQKAGYPGTTAKYSIGIDESTGRATVTFNITESQKVKIKEIDFVGAQAFSQRQLRKVIKTRKHWMFSWITGSGVFKDDQFEDDKEKLSDFYHNKGYIDFDIKDIQFEHPTPRTLVIRIIVYEGRQYKVGSIKFTGNKLFSSPEIAEGIRRSQPQGVLKKIKIGPNGMIMDVGDIFTPDGLNKDMQAIGDFYGAKGYIDVSPYSRGLNVERIPNTDTGTMDLEFQIDEGQKNYIEKIEIRGNTKTKDRVIRRELAVSPGETFDMVRVKLSQARLENLQYFEKVDTKPEATEISGHKNLIVGVDEKNTGNLTMGAGFSSVDSVVGFVEVSQGNFDLFNPPNFTGGGQKFRLRVQLGTERQDYEVSFTEPWFLGRKLRLDVDLFRHDLNFQSVENLYDEVQTGGRIGLTRALGSDFFIGGVGYTLQQEGILFNDRTFRTNDFGGRPVVGQRPIPNALLEQGGYHVLSKFDFSLAYDTRNSVTLPNKGGRTELTAVLAGPFPGDRDYYKLELKSAWYFKGFFPGHVLELGGESGVADSYGSTGDVPFYDRYFLGGPNSLRGFRFRSVAPRESPLFPAEGASREPIGGDTYWFGWAEYSLPIIQSPKENGVGLRFAMFYDIGSVMLSPYTYNFTDYLDNWGLGIRLNLPIGPLRLDYGIPLHHDRFNSGSGQFQFNVGYTRPF